LSASGGILFSKQPLTKVQNKQKYKITIRQRLLLRLRRIAMTRSTLFVRSGQANNMDGNYKMGTDVHGFLTRMGTDKTPEYQL